MYVIRPRLSRDRSRKRLDGGGGTSARSHPHTFVRIECLSFSVDQAAFWDYMSKIKAPTDSSETNPDAERDARRIIAEMSEIEKDLGNPDKIVDAVRKHMHVVEELKELSRELGPDVAVPAMKKGIEMEGSEMTT